MKTSMLLLAGLLIASTGSALAEGGGARAKQYFENFPISQQPSRTSSDTTASTDSKKPDAPSSEQPSAPQKPDV